jgi:hypothetical protein
MTAELNTIKSIFVIREHKLWYSINEYNGSGYYGHDMENGKCRLSRVPSDIPHYYVTTDSHPTGKYIQILETDLGFRALRIGDKFNFADDCLKDVEIDKYRHIYFREENEIIDTWQTADAQYYLVKGDAVLDDDGELVARMEEDVARQNLPYLEDQKKQIADLYETAEFDEEGRLVMDKRADLRTQAKPKLKPTKTYDPDVMLYAERDEILVETKSIIAKIKEWYRK